MAKSIKPKSQGMQHLFACFFDVIFSQNISFINRNLSHHQRQVELKELRQKIGDQNTNPCPADLNRSIKNPNLNSIAKNQTLTPPPGTVNY